MTDVLEITHWNQIPLWEHQRQAVDLVQRYLDSEAAESGKSCVIRMPTGTGKTAIIATLCIPLLADSHFLVVAPSDTLRSQLTREIKTRFWEKVGVDIAGFETEVQLFRARDVQNTLASAKQYASSVMVTTIQSLQRLRDHSRSDYCFLKNHITHVIFDEGHREPAPAWAEAVRGLEKPTILFTATPYRNDYAVFSFDESFLFTFSFQEALDRCFVRKVHFEELEEDATESDLIKAVIEATENSENDPSLPEGCRAIIKCGDLERIKAVSGFLMAEGRDFIAVHENLETSDRRYQRIVPDPMIESAPFWIHQHKLTEGFDDPRFAIVAFLDPATTGRELVQQIGRVIRNPSQKADQRAIVICRKGDRQKKFWDRYLAFEKDGALAFDFEELVENAIKSQGEARYVEGDFRTRFDPYVEGFERFLEFPRSANIFLKKEAFRWEAFLQVITREWESRNRSCANRFTHTFDIENGEDQPSATVELILFIAHRNSPKLIDSYFFEFDLGYTIAVEIGNLLFYYDTQGVVPRYFEKKVRPLSANKLSKLFGEGSRASNVSLANADLGKASVRRRAMSAQNLAETPPGLADHSHCASTIRGHVPDGEKSRARYLGFKRGRTSDAPLRGFTIEDYCEWISEIYLQLHEQGRNPDQLFSRYANPSDPPSDTTPRHLLLDIAQEELSYVNRDGETLRLDEPGTEIDENGQGVIVANGQEFNVTIKYDAESESYELSSPELDQAYNLTTEAEKGDFRRGVASQYNFSKNFRVATSTPWVVYINDQFLSARQNTQTVAKHLLSVFTSVERIGKPRCTSEKGSNGSATSSGWESNSLFAQIDDRTAQDPLGDALREFDILVCDDRGRNESSDFIALHSTEPRVAFIHAKSKDQVLSASAFMDVCGQATKNLAHLSPYVALEPVNTASNRRFWDGVWNGGDIGIVETRTRRAPADWDGEMILNRLREVVQNPLSRREVWIVYGCGFRKEKFAEEMRKTDPSPEAIQFYYLLESTWNSVSQVGAQFRVFCP